MPLLPPLLPAARPPSAKWPCGGQVRQLSYHIGSTLVSSGLWSALLAPVCTKNAGIISFFEPPSATALTKGLLLILDHVSTSLRPRPLARTPTGPPHHHPSHLPLTSTLQTLKKLKLPKRSWAELYEVDWKHPCPFPKLCQVKDSGSALTGRRAALSSHLHLL